MFRSLIFCIFITISIFAHITKQGQEEKIRGGRDASINQIPFQVSLNRTGGFICGGSIISKSFILTAAHCTGKDPEPSHYMVRTGSSVTKQDGQLHRVTRIIPHENYNPTNSKQNDICLLQIDPPVSFDSKQQPVDLATDAGSLPAGYTVSVSGFGKPSENEPVSERLKVVDLPIIDWNECHDLYKNSGKRVTVTEDFICAGVMDSSLNSCDGDSGGPLFTKSKVLVGIVSWGVGCSKPSYPGAYSNVSFFMKWIIQKLAEVGEKAKFRSYMSSKPIIADHREPINVQGQGHQSNGQEEWHDSEQPELMITGQNWLGNLFQGHYYPSHNLHPGTFFCLFGSYPQKYYGSGYYSSPSSYGLHGSGYSPFGSGYVSDYVSYYNP